LLDSSRASLKFARLYADLADAENQCASAELVQARLFAVLAGTRHQLALSNRKLAEAETKNAETSSSLALADQRLDHARDHVRELTQARIRSRGYIIKLESRLKAALAKPTVGGLRRMELGKKSLRHNMKDVSVGTERLVVSASKQPAIIVEKYPLSVQPCKPIVQDTTPAKAEREMVKVIEELKARKKTVREDPSESQLAQTQSPGQEDEATENEDMANISLMLPTTPPTVIASPRIVIGTPQTTPTQSAPKKFPQSQAFDRIKSFHSSRHSRAPLQAASTNLSTPARGTPIKSTPRKFRPLHESIAAHPIVTGIPTFKRKDLTPRKITLATDLYQALRLRDLRTNKEYVSAICCCDTHWLTDRRRLGKGGLPIKALHLGCKAIRSFTPPVPWYTAIYDHACGLQPS